MITGLSAAALYWDSIGIHDFRDPETWQKKPEGGWTIGNATVTGITLSDTNPVSVLATAHGMSTGQNAKFSDVVGTVELNGKTYKVTVVDVNNFTLDDTDSSDFTAWVSGGSIAWNNYDSRYTVEPSPGQAIVLENVWLKVSSDAVMHSALQSIQRKKDGTIIKQTNYDSLDDFLDRFTGFQEIELTRYTNPIEFHTYELDQPIALRSADTPQGAIIPYLYTMELRIADDQPYKNNGGEIEFLKVRYPGVGYFIDVEYVAP